MLDYIVVGSGLAGIAFSEIALQNHKTILVINDDSQNSSKIAGGLYNPVILKRFSEVWQAGPQLELLSEFYSGLESKLGVKLDYKLPLLLQLLPTSGSYDIYAIIFIFLITNLHHRILLFYGIKFICSHGSHISKLLFQCSCSLLQMTTPIRS